MAFGALLLALSAHAVPESVIGETGASQHQQQLQVEALKDLQQAHLDTVRAQLAAVDKRVDDLNTHVGHGVDRLGVYATVMGILVTVLLAGLGLLGFISVTRKTKAEAQDAASAWFEEKAAALEKRLQDIESKASVTRQQMDNTAQAVHEHGEALKKKHENAFEHALKEMQANMAEGTSGAALSHASAQAVAVVQERAEELKKTPESSYSVSDWDARAHAAYAANKLEEAALFWQKASQIPNADALNVAQVLFNRGVALGQMGQTDAAIATYDEVLRRFGTNTEPALREPVANALFNKGATQGLIDQDEAAIATYKELLRRFGDSSEQTLTEYLAKAMVNKAFREGKLGHCEAEAATYEQLLNQFGGASEPAVREQVAKAMINRAFWQRRRGEGEAETATYEDLLRRFGEATELALREPVAAAHNGVGFQRICDGKALWYTDPARAKALWQEALGHLNMGLARLEPASMNGIILGNRAYVLALMGDTTQAEALFAQALRAPADGGKKLYDAVQSDFDVHPIPQDQAMRELVERQWQIWQTEQGGDSPSPAST